MIKNKSELNVEEFKKDLDAGQLLDDDETIDDFLNYLSSNDDIKFYNSKWGDKECKFIQTSGTNGFEYIFVNDNDMGKQFSKINENLDFSGFKMNKTLNNISIHSFSILKI
jgi:hypothetical protein